MATSRPAGGCREPGWPQEHAGRSPAAVTDISGRGSRPLLLMTTGRRSGEPRTTPLIHGRDGDRYVVVASRGGVPEHSGKARARTATAAERPALWKTMAAIWPPYDEYQAKTTREIPVVILDPVPAEGT